MIRLRLLGAFWLALGCASSPPPAPPAPPAAPVSPAPAATAARDPLADPPASGVTPSAPFPIADRRTLANGLELRTVSRRNLPIVELRLVVRSGTATDGDRPGVAAVAGELMKAGGAGPWDARALVERAESLGADLDILTDRDATRISLAVTTADLDAALDILAAVAMKPRFDPGELKKLKDREIERAQSSAKASAGYAAAVVLYRELFSTPTAIHPYSLYDALPADFARLTLRDCKDWHARHVTPENSVLVVAGDVEPAALETAVTRAFGTWKGPRPERTSFPSPVPDTERHLYLVDRPGSGQSVVYVGVLGPERQGEEWPSVAALNQVLGGGVSGRLFMDVREKRSLAYSTSSALDEVAHGASPIVLSAGTQTDKAPLAVQALLENLNRIGGTAPKPEELEIATRYLSDSFLFRTETVGAVADMTAKLAILSLPDDYYDDYRSAVRKLDVDTAYGRGARYFASDRAVIVVAGDAAKLEQRLTHFGKVILIDPVKGFTPGKMLPKNPGQPLQ